jgi:hypothetical protein
MLSKYLDGIKRKMGWRNVAHMGVEFRTSTQSTIN